MTHPLDGKIVVLGVTGSIAAYKAAMVARLLVKAGARVRTVLSRGAREFVGAATFGGITSEPVLSDMFDATYGGERHVELAREADLIVVAPATADLLARMATGRADDLLTATLLSATCPVVVAPAMHPNMWQHPATQRNVETLKRDGRVAFAGPVVGEVASRETGIGRLAEPEDIVGASLQALVPTDLDGRHVVVTAGPTVEDIDAVRFIGNRSSGKMGFSIAENAAQRGARVTLIAGPVSLSTPAGVERIDVRSALDMRGALWSTLGEDLSGADALIMTAAVGDFRAAKRHDGKLKRGDDALELALEQNPDLLAEIGARRSGPRPVLVGFAVETGTDAAIVGYARKKLKSKRVDVVIANHADESMGRDDNRITFVSPEGERAEPTSSKAVLAARIVDWLEAKLSG